MAFPSVPGANDTPTPYFVGLKALGYGVHIGTNRYSSSVIEVGPNIWFEPTCPSLFLTWGTDLLPHEIEANKPSRVLNSDSKVWNFIGTVDSTKKWAINEFGRAAKENGIETNMYGGFGGTTVSDEQNQKLIKDSYLAPAFQEKGQNDTGYLCCRLFKNISYGQYGITQSRFANELFNGRLIYNPDNAYNLFYESKERLSSMSVSELHSLMDEVAAKHTYVNKVNGLIAAIKYLESR